MSEFWFKTTSLWKARVVCGPCAMNGEFRGGRERLRTFMFCLSCLFVEEVSYLESSRLRIVWYYSLCISTYRWAIFIKIRSFGTCTWVLGTTIRPIWLFFNLCLKSSFYFRCNSGSGFSESGTIARTATPPAYFLRTLGEMLLIYFL